MLVGGMACKLKRKIKMDPPSKRIPANVALKLMARTDNNQPIDLFQRFQEDAILRWINDAVRIAGYQVLWIVFLFSHEVK